MDAGDSINECGRGDTLWVLLNPVMVGTPILSRLQTAASLSYGPNGLVPPSAITWSSRTRSRYVLMVSPLPKNKRADHPTARAEETPSTGNSKEKAPSPAPASAESAQPSAEQGFSNTPFSQLESTGS